MRTIRNTLLMMAAMLLASGPALADKYSDSIDLFKNAGQSGSFFAKCYGYALFPTIGKAGLGIGGAHGDGQVYEQGKQVGTTSMTQLSIGFQAGAEGYSEIIFFEDKRSFDEFTSGNFEFGANVSGGDHRGRVGVYQHWSLYRECQRRQEGRGDCREVQQGHGGLHHLEGRPDVRSVCLGTEVQVQAAEVRAAARRTQALAHPAVASTAGCGGLLGLLAARGLE